MIDLFFTITFFFHERPKTKNQHCLTCYVIFMIYTLIDHSSRPISAREDSFRYCKKYNTKRDITTH